MFQINSPISNIQVNLWIRTVYCFLFFPSKLLMHSLPFYLRILSYLVTMLLAFYVILYIVFVDYLVIFYTFQSAKISLVLIDDYKTPEQVFHTDKWLIYSVFFVYISLEQSYVIYHTTQLLI